jgi:ABC-type transporter Mla subunit MlaD
MDDRHGDLFAIDGGDVGALLMGQLEDLIDSWAKVIEVVAQHGIDPTPLLQTLAGTLRATADQLDPGDRTASNGS